MIRPGLCSITLRALSVDEVVDVAVGAGIECVEWGGDVHVPPGDSAAAAHARRRCADAGLRIASYGSYFTAGVTPPAEFDGVLAAAVALGAPRIRVWAGAVGSAEADEVRRNAVVHATRHAADLAADEGVEVSFEFHGNSLTDDVDSTLRLLDDVARPNVTSYWQPPVGMPADDAVSTLHRLGPRLSAVHVFSWWPGIQRLPLRARADLWRSAFAQVAMLERPVDALLEFVPGDDPAAVATEAAALRELAGAG